MIIFLNGTSSAGKTSIAKVLLDKLKHENYAYIGLDTFVQPILPPHINYEIPEHWQLIDAAMNAFNHALAPISAKIPNLIIDHVLQSKAWRNDVSAALQGRDVFMVGVQAPLAVLEQREKQRTDFRKPGTAKLQYDFVMSCEHDLVIDTHQNDAVRCADLIIKNVRPGKSLHTVM